MSLSEYLLPVLETLSSDLTLMLICAAVPQLRKLESWLALEQDDPDVSQYEVSKDAKRWRQIKSGSIDKQLRIKKRRSSVLIIKKILKVITYICVHSLINILICWQKDPPVHIYTIECSLLNGLIKAHQVFDNIQNLQYCNKKAQSVMPNKTFFTFTSYTNLCCYIWLNHETWPVLSIDGLASGGNNQCFGASTCPRPSLGTSCSDGNKGQLCHPVL